jgi:hypothetical protein
MIKANPLLEAHGLVTILSNKRTENNASNPLAGRKIGQAVQLNTVPLSSTVPPQHRILPKPSISLDSDANERQRSKVNPQLKKTNSFGRRSLSVDSPVGRSKANEVSEAMNIRRIQSVADMQGKILSYSSV